MNFAVAGCQHFHIKMFIDEMIGLGHKFIGIYDKGDYYLAEQYSKEYNVPLYEDLDELLGKKPDIIGNAERNDQKIDIIEKAERYGINVMTDKPIAVNYDGLKRLKDVISRGKIKIGMMLTERFTPALYTLKKMIDDNELGQILDMTFLKPHKLLENTRPEWFFSKEQNGGLIVDIMIHDIDLIRWLTGHEIKESKSFLVKNRYNRHDDFYNLAQVNVELDNCCMAVLKSDWLMPEAYSLWGDGRIFVTGTNGRAEIRSAGDPLGEKGPFLTLTTYKSSTVKCKTEEPDCCLSQDFINYINGNPHILDAQDIYKCNEDVLKIDEKAIKVKADFKK